MLNIQNLSYLQGGITLLQDVNLQVYPDQRIGLVFRIAPEEPQVAGGMGRVWEWSDCRKLRGQPFERRSIAEKIYTFPTKNYAPPKLGRWREEAKRGRINGGAPWIP